ncbi:DUF5658 family protein [Clostridium baratii]|uniref:DUF5658 family protein n=1 Tax=Clostridium baratii TaxID=1561 RepID=UPI00374F4DA9
MRRCCPIFLFIKEYSCENIKKKIQLLYFLNVTDIIFTLLLLQTGMFKEGNSVMVNIVESPAWSLIIKVVIIGILLFLLIKMMLMATNKQLYISNYIINGALGIYSIINLMHIIYIVMFLVIKNFI